MKGRGDQIWTKSVLSTPTLSPRFAPGAAGTPPIEGGGNLRENFKYFWLEFKLKFFFEHGAPHIISSGGRPNCFANSASSLKRSGGRGIPSLCCSRSSSSSISPGIQIRYTPGALGLSRRMAQKASTAARNAFRDTRASILKAANRWGTRLGPAKSRIPMTS